MFIFVNAYIV